MYIDNIMNCMTGRAGKFARAIPELKKAQEVRDQDKPPDYKEFRNFILLFPKKEWINKIIRVYDDVQNRQWNDRIAKVYRYLSTYNSKKTRIW